MEVTFLGTGNAFGSGGRHSLSILVQTGGFGVLLDCGAATLPTLKRLGLSPQSVDCVLISHHHGDHFGGVPFLLLEYQYETLRKKPLSVIGPPGTGQKITQLTELLFPGLKTKSPGYELTYVDMDAEGSRQLGPVEVLPFRVHHFPEGIAFGYRISTEGRTVVYSGDTEWTDELGCRSQEADLFICECSSLERKIPFHMSHKELESHRDRIGAKRTLLVHAGDDVLARRSDLIFELAEDGQKVRLG
jgi:ribonuclease BN (tRNA processing enzyme)